MIFLFNYIQHRDNLDIYPNNYGENVAFNPDLHHRKSHRLEGFNYKISGTYFITICTQHREQLFGKITDGKMNLNSAGQIIQRVWDELPIFYPNIDTDEFVVMPDHIHGIIIVGAAPCGRPNVKNLTNLQEGPQGAASTTISLSLPEVVHRFKSLSTKRFSDEAKREQATGFTGRLWQRNYWERIVRDDTEWQALRKYIRENPSKAIIPAKTAA